ncbi:hypothetical protein ILYODFUR_017353 [Ilyodon furcidens]|uniref:Uncharacterized protein n=1 Tax=Ilyodon furcidens TaxID=33524 RepID=A0ABV0TVW1_9TELE
MKEMQEPPCCQLHEHPSSFSQLISPLFFMLTSLAKIHLTHCFVSNKNPASLCFLPSCMLSHYNNPPIIGLTANCRVQTLGIALFYPSTMAVFVQNLDMLS